MNRQELPLPRWVRLLLVVSAIFAWHLSQSLVGQRPPGQGIIGDGLLDFLAPVNAFLNDRPAWSQALLIVSSAVVDLLGLFLLAASIFGPSLRPFVSLVLVFVLRQACQLLCAPPLPAGMIWYDPGVPSLLVTYSITNDLFFSGHTAIAVLGAVELARYGTRWFSLGVLAIVFEVFAVLALRGHYTMDVFAGAVTALLVAGITPKLIPHLDRVRIAVKGPPFTAGLRA